ncbi:hypothetical protein [Adhaeretor mobilis]|nr:hypothetical protein [Adhaeretor mobilis]
MVTWVLVASIASETLAEDFSVREVRFRFIWGRGATQGTKQVAKWSGRILVESGSLANLQPLGTYTDEAEALRLVEGELLITPRQDRPYDGCDLTVKGTRESVVHLELTGEEEQGGAKQKEEISATLGALIDKPGRYSLSGGRGYLVIDRAPGDQLRVAVDRKSMVFSPTEDFLATLTVGSHEDLTEEKVQLQAVTKELSTERVVDQQSLEWDRSTSDSLALTFKAPREEGAYKIEFSLRGENGFATRWIGVSQGTPLLARTIELVVVDPEASLNRLTSELEEVLTIDPANPTWWQRLPKWARRTPLPGVSQPAPLGNTRLVGGSQPGMVSLPACRNEAEPYWQAFTLPVRSVDQPHVVEIALPAGRDQHLAISVIEPNAAGRVQEFGRDTGTIFTAKSALASPEGSATRRITFWPRTATPVLLVANRSSAESAEFGRLTLSQIIQKPADEKHSLTSSDQRLVAAYLDLPNLVRITGAPQRFDKSTGLSVDSWHTHLVAAQRLAQQLHSGGYNAAVITVAAEGSSLAPVAGLGTSARCNSAKLTEVDCIPRDVLELLLRIFQREGLRLIPSVQLSHALPALEQLRAEEPARHDLLVVGRTGRSYREETAVSRAEGPRYNLLSPEIQSRLEEVLLGLTDRYSGHQCLAGIGIQIAGDGYGTLPGLAWGMDDTTCARFARDTGLTIPARGPHRFDQRAQLFATTQRAEWTAWRQTMITDYYSHLATSLKKQRADWNLVLCTDRLFSGPQLEEGLQQAAVGNTTLEAELALVGIDLTRLASTKSVALLRPRKLNAGQSVQQRAVARYLNTTREMLSISENSLLSGTQLFHDRQDLRLPSFDLQSPFPGTTQLSLSSATLPTDDTARQALVEAIAGDDPEVLLTDSPFASLGDNANIEHLVATLGKLPAPKYEARREQRQPITMRVFREFESTTVCIVNDSPWPVDIALPLTSEESTSYEKLGIPAKTADYARGKLVEGNATWSFQLRPYDVSAWRFDTKRVRLDSPEIKLPEEASQQLQDRITRLEERLGRLDIRRPYPGLMSPGFEAAEQNSNGEAWQVRLGQRGSVDFRGEQRTGKRALRLVSEDAVGVAAESNSFSIPNTGRLAVGGWYRLATTDPTARLHLAIEYDVPRGVRRMHQTLGPTGEDWNECELVVEEINGTENARVRVQIHLTGQGEALVDDLELYDLQFDRNTRIELAKRVFSAKTALQQGQVTDCLRLVDGYLPRYLLANVPDAPGDITPSGLAETTPTPMSPTAPTKTPRLTDRFKKWTPRLWR